MILIIKPPIKLPPPNGYIPLKEEDKITNDTIKVFPNYIDGMYGEWIGVVASSHITEVFSPFEIKNKIKVYKPSYWLYRPDVRANFKPQEIAPLP